MRDPRKLEGEEFFTEAKAGDRLLIFSEAKKAILYRPSVRAVVAIGPIE